MDYSVYQKGYYIFPTNYKVDQSMTTIILLFVQGEATLLPTRLLELLLTYIFLTDYEVD